MRRRQGRGRLGGGRAFFGGAPFSYRPGSSAFHRMPAWLKLLGLAGFSALAFSSPRGLALAALLLALACAAARIPPPALLRGARPLAALALALAFARALGPGARGICIPEFYAAGMRFGPAHVPGASAEGFLSGAEAGLRILAVFAASGFLFSVTTMRDMRLSLAALEIGLKGFFRAIRRRLRRGKPAGSAAAGLGAEGSGEGGSGAEPGGGEIAYASLGISLMLGFVPRFFEVWEAADLSCRARSCRGGLRRLLALAPLAAEAMLEAAAQTALALEARGLCERGG